jgi:hypothetical protein
MLSKLFRFSSLMGVLASVLLPVVTYAASYGDSFETWVSGAPDGWRVFNASPSADAHTGSYAVQLESEGELDKYLNFAPSLIGQTLHVTVWTKGEYYGQISNTNADDLFCEIPPSSTWVQTTCDLPIEETFDILTFWAFPDAVLLVDDVTYSYPDPPAPTATATSTPTSVPPTATATSTPTSVPPTATHTTAEPTSEPTAEPTNEPTVAPTSSPTATEVPSPTPFRRDRYLHRRTWMFAAP